MKTARLRTSALLFFAYAAFGSIGAYLSLFYREQGMSLEQVGLLAAVPAGMSMLAAPLWAALADRFHLHKYVLPFAMLFSLPFAFIFPSLSTFGQLFLGIFLFAGCYSAIMPLSDNAVLVNLGERRTEYGRVRLWGSIGIGIMAYITGWLIQRSNLDVIFPVYMVFMTIAALMALTLPKPPQIKLESYWKRAGQFLQDRRWRIFLSGCLLSGFAHLFLGYYIFIFVKNLGADEGYIGSIILLAAAANIITYYLMPHFLKRWTASQILIFSNILLTVRMVIASLIRHPDMSIIVQLLDGPTWGTMWSAGVHYASEIAPRGLGASAQALYNGIFLGLGGIISSGLGGIIYARLGASTLFLIGAISAALSVIVFVTMQKSRPLISNQSSEGIKA